VIIENYPEGQVEDMEAVNNPEDASMGTRQVPFSRVLYIERDDFREDPPRQFFRLAPGREVRLRYAYYITCTGVVKNERTGEVVELRCTYDPATRGGWAPDGRQVKSTIHWVSAAHAIPATVLLYDHLFLKPDPGADEDGGDVAASLNPKSLEVLTGCQLEPSLAGATPGSRYQFERQGYFCVDPDTRPGALVFNRTVTLRDTWARIRRGEAEVESAGGVAEELCPPLYADTSSAGYIDDHRRCGHTGVECKSPSLCTYVPQRSRSRGPVWVIVLAARPSASTRMK
jgi:glutaminyl-tRNA synthetase